MKTSESQTFNKHWIHRTFRILNKIQGCIIFSSNFQTKFRKHSKLQTISRHSLISRQFYQTYQPCYVCMCVGRSALCVHVCWSVCLVCRSVCLVCWSVCLVCRSVLLCAELVWTLDNQISRQYLRIDTIFPESQLKKDMFFPDRLVERSIIFQTAETIKHPFSHGTFQSHGYGFTSHLFHVVVKNRAK